MDHDRFDRLAVLFAHGATRRTFLHRFGGASLAALFGFFGRGHDPDIVAAKGPGKHHRRKAHRRKSAARQAHPRAMAKKAKHCGKKGKACCAPDDSCRGALGCVSGVCTKPIHDGGACPSGETKCGGACTNLAVDNAHCGDCAIACTAPEKCLNGICGPVASCGDGSKNGDETDIDCGGSCGATCASGQTCAGDGDCATGHCENGACGPLPPCRDGVQNGNESDVDCGGGSCPRCGEGKTCRVSTDCASRRCLSGTCQPWPFCLAGQEYCPASREQVQCRPGCACATSVETGATVCAGHSVRHCSTCTTDAECTTLLLLIGFPDTPGVCTRDLGGCACPGTNVCAPADCGCGSDGSLCG